MSELLSLRQGVIDAVSAALPALKSVEAHGGRFTREELRQFIVRAPAARVAILAIGPGTRHQSGGALHEVEVAVYVIAEDHRGLTRDTALLTMVNQILILQKGARFGVACADPALPGRAITMHTEAAKGSTADIWAVTWKQPVLFAAAPEPDPEALSALYVSAAPLIGAAHEDAYTRVPVLDEAA